VTHYLLFRFSFSDFDDPTVSDIGNCHSNNCLIFHLNLKKESIIFVRFKKNPHVSIMLVSKFEKKIIYIPHFWLLLMTF
jgi:hypothetical protein